MMHPEDLLVSAADGSISASDRARLDEHLAGCERCRAELASASSARHALRRLPAVEPPAELSARIDRALGWDGAAARPALRRSSQRWTAAVAGLTAAAVIALAVLVAPRIGGSSSHPAERAVGPGAYPSTVMAAPDGVAFVITPQDFNSSSIQQLSRPLAPPDASEGASGMNTRTSSQMSSLMTADSAYAPALACLRRGSAPNGDSVLTELIQARYEGQPAYIGVYSSGSHGSRSEVWIVHVGSCTVFATASLPHP